MSFRLQANESPREATERITREQIENTLEKFTSQQAGHAATVHRGRVTCKRLRGLLRLMRPALRKNFAAENEALRTAANLFADQRDARVQVDLLKQLSKKRDPGASDALLESISLKLAENIQVSDSSTLDTRSRDFVAALERVLQRFKSWEWKTKSLGSVVELGFAATYRKGRTAMKSVLDTPCVEQLHNLRKWVKYHGYQLELIRGFGISGRRRRLSRIHRLEKLLGRVHDLEGLSLRISQLEFPDYELAEVMQLVEAIAERRRGLQTRAIRLGRKLYSKRTRRIRKLVHSRFKGRVKSS